MLVFNDVSKHYNNNYALQDISLSIRHGEFVFVVGHTGSGKTTLINLLMGDIKPDSGSIMVDDVDISRLDRDDLQLYRRNIGIIFQDFKLIPKYTVYENILLSLEVCEYPQNLVNKKINDIADFIGIQNKLNLYPVQLSGGEKQKVAIARAIVHDPKLLIADEPTGNLDPDSTTEILTLLLKVNNQGYTVILTTHNVNLVNLLQKRVIRMEKGNVISDKIGGYY